jgi:hypothetical protein
MTTPTFLHNFFFEKILLQKFNLIFIVKIFIGLKKINKHLSLPITFNAMLKLPSANHLALTDTLYTALNNVRAYFHFSANSLPQMF